MRQSIDSSQSGASDRLSAAANAEQSLHVARFDVGSSRAVGNSSQLVSSSGRFVLMLDFGQSSVSRVTEKDAGRKAFWAGKTVRDCPFCDQRRWAWLEGWHQEERAQLAPVGVPQSSLLQSLPD